MEGFFRHAHKYYTQNSARLLHFPVSSNNSRYFRYSSIFFFMVYITINKILKKLALSEKRNVKKNKNKIE